MTLLSWGYSEKEKMEPRLPQDSNLRRNFPEDYMKDFKSAALTTRPDSRFGDDVIDRSTNSYWAVRSGGEFCAFLPHRENIILLRLSSRKQDRLSS